MQNTAIEFKQDESTIGKVWNISPFMTSVVIAHLALVLICLVGLVFDSRTILGESVWIKPMKFAISITLYGFS